MLYDEIDYKLTWAAMEKLVEKGHVRSIGLSNFNSRQIDDILSVASIKPTVLQVQPVCVNTAVARRRFVVLMATDHPAISLFAWTGRGASLPGPGRAAGPLSGPGPGDDGLQPSGLS